MCPVIVHLNWGASKTGRMCGLGVGSSATDGVHPVELRWVGDSRTHNTPWCQSHVYLGNQQPPPGTRAATSKLHPHLSASLLSCSVQQAEPAKASLANIACKSLVQTACPLSSAG